MTIKTKYNLNDTVWFMDNSRAECKPIWNIKITVHDGVVYVNYVFFVFFESKGHDNHTELPEYFCFPTKEALLQSL